MKNLFCKIANYCTFLYALFLVCSCNRGVFPVIKQERQEKNVIIFRHIGTQTASIPTIIILPKSDTLKNEVFNSYLKRVSIVEFDSISGYLNKKLPVLKSTKDCQCEYNGEPGSYKITVINNGASAIYFLDCRNCTRAVFLNIKQELNEQKGAMGLVKNISISLIP